MGIRTAECCAAGMVCGHASLARLVCSTAVVRLLSVEQTKSTVSGVIDRLQVYKQKKLIFIQATRLWCQATAKAIRFGKTMVYLEAYGCTTMLTQTPALTVLKM